MMSDLHLPFWPKGLAKELTVPKTTLHSNLEITARRYPDKAALVFYDYVMTYRQLFDAWVISFSCSLKSGKA